MSNLQRSIAGYAVVLVALLCLTAATTAAHFLNLGPWHLPVALSIATFKGLLVALFFMHLLGSMRLIWLSVGVGILWLALLIGLTLTDYVTRRPHLRDWSTARSQIVGPMIRSARLGSQVTTDAIII
jgi:cytochrome c oxidase subunit 4